MILVTGPGRSGTSLLMALFTFLGLDTGFDEKEFERVQSSNSKAGFERHQDPCPYIVKCIWCSEKVDAMVNKHDFLMEHVILPMRNLEDSVQSRKLVANLGEENGGFDNASNEDEQKRVNCRRVYNLLHDLAKNDIPFTLLHFPRLANDAEYLWGKLEWLFQKHEISKEKFLEVHAKVSNPNLINFS
jgi:hypothetical protein